MQDLNSRGFNLTGRNSRTYAQQGINASIRASQNFGRSMGRRSTTRQGTLTADLYIVILLGKDTRLCSLLA